MMGAVGAIAALDVSADLADAAARRPCTSKQFTDGQFLVVNYVGELCRVILKGRLRQHNTVLNARAG